MALLGDLAEVFRSKNAGPFLITVDLMFADRERFERVANASSLSAQEIARRYGVEAADVRVIPFPHALAIKVTLPRTAGSRGSGSPGDRDVYGAQQHGLMLDIDIE